MSKTDLITTPKRCYDTVMSAAGAVLAANLPLDVPAYYAALERLATLPARTLVEVQAKARALATCFIGGCIEADRGVAASLIADLLRLT